VTLSRTPVVKSESVILGPLKKERVYSDLRIMDLNFHYTVYDACALHAGWLRQEYRHTLIVLSKYINSMATTVMRTRLSAYTASVVISDFYI
jgi:hypothetical protein